MHILVAPNYGRRKATDGSTQAARHSQQIDTMLMWIIVRGWRRDARGPHARALFPNLQLEVSPARADISLHDTQPDGLIR